MNDLHRMTLVEAAGAIAARKLSPVELMSALLERIGRLDPKLNVFIRLDAEAAMEEARAAEAEIVSGRLRGPLHGVHSRSAMVPRYRQARPTSATLSRTSRWSRRRTRAISSIERPRKSKLPSSVSSASDHSLLVSAAGGSSPTAVPYGSTMEAPMHKGSAPGRLHPAHASLARPGRHADPIRL
jgi:hypothetical protein